MNPGEGGLAAAVIGWPEMLVGDPLLDRMRRT